MADPPVGPTVSAAVSSQLTLKAQQSTLLEVFRDRDPVPASMYLGALTVLADTSNPDRISLAAHGVRELIEKLPPYFDLPIPTRRALGTEVRNLHQAWDSARKKQTNDGHLPRKFVKQLTKFFDWFEIDRPQWAEKTETLLKTLDPSGRALPAPIAKLRTEEWLKCRDFFVETAHHRTDVGDSEFDEWLDYLERFLLDLVRPRTFENADAIDALIKEGEGSA